MLSPIVLINMFEVPAGTEGAFIEWWRRSSDELSKEPGFIDAQLHRSLKSDADYSFINVAHWETEDALNQALARHQEVLRTLAAGQGHPARYKVEIRY